MIESKESAEVTTEGTAASDASHPWGRFVLLLALVLMLVLAIAVGALARDRGDKLNAVRHLEDSRAAALEAAREFAVLVTTYDPKTLDASFEAVLDSSTGDFHDQYAMASDSLRDTIVEVNGSAKGEVIAAGISKASDDQVEIVVFLDQTVANRLLDEPRVDRSRMSVVMERSGDRWQVSEMRLL